MLAWYDHVCDGTRFLFSRIFLKSARSLKTLLGKKMVQKGALDRWKKCQVFCSKELDEKRAFMQRKKTWKYNLPPGGLASFSLTNII
jgi:hypothetical protein